MWFEYSQNNSGGSHQYDDTAGISEWVFIEADSAKAADETARSIGIYFDGVDQDMDCGCCGDRWHPNEGTWDAIPFDQLEERVRSIMKYGWRTDGNSIYLHFKDGAFIGDKDKGMMELSGRLKELE